MAGLRKLPARHSGQGLQAACDTLSLRQYSLRVVPTVRGLGLVDPKSTRSVCTRAEPQLWDASPFIRFGAFLLLLAALDCRGQASLVGFVRDCSDAAVPEAARDRHSLADPAAQRSRAEAAVSPYGGHAPGRLFFGYGYACYQRSPN